MTSKHKIITFYSFKGGAGRSQLAVNLAAYLFFYAKKKVLLIDWDLEAPGLDAFFKNFEEEAKKRNSADNTFIKRFDRKTIERGLLDVLEDYVKIMQEGRKLEIEDLPFLDEKAIYSLWHDEKTGAKIDLVPAINYNREDYTHIINRFDWFDFYDRLKGNYYMETLKEKLHATDYDYIFIDSRTGLSDYSGICNIQLPDANVIVVAPTQQNLNGAKMMIDKIKSSPYTEHQRPQAVILPVLSRIDLSEENMFVEWTNKFKNSFAEDIALSLKNAGLGIEVETYINDTTLRYVKELAYGENILFNENSNGITAGSLAEKFENILGYLEVLEGKITVIKNNEDGGFISRLYQFVENGNYASFFEDIDKNIEVTPMYLANFNDLKYEFIKGNWSSSFSDRLKVFISLGALKHKPKIPKVYLSYSHKDMEFTKVVHDYLQSNNINVLSDLDMKAGDNISAFLKNYYNLADIIVLLLSTNSFYSKYVLLDLYNGMNNQDKIIIPIILNSEIYDINFTDLVLDYIDIKLHDIYSAMGKRREKKRSFEDLQSEVDVFLMLKNNIPKLMQFVRGHLALHLTNNNHDENLKELVKAIKSSV